MIPASRFLPALLLCLPGGERIVFAPAPGAVLVKTLQVDVHMSLESSELTFLGERNTSMRFCPDVTCERQWNLELRDEYVRVGEDGPEQMRRGFERATLHSERERYGFTRSPLSGLRIEITRDSRSAGSALAYASEDRFQDERLLAGLPSDLELCGLLPRGCVRAGDSWYVEAAALGDVLSLDEVPFDLPEGFCPLPIGLGACGGDLRVELAGRSDCGGAEVARLRFAGDLEGEALLAAVDPRFRIESYYDLFVNVVDREVRVRCELEGGVDWNLDRGCWEALDLAVDFRLEITEAGSCGDSEVVNRVVWTGRMEVVGVMEAAAEGR